MNRPSTFSYVSKKKFRMYEGKLSYTFIKVQNFLLNFVLSSLEFDKAACMELETFLSQEHTEKSSSTAILL